MAGSGWAQAARQGSLRGPGSLGVYGIQDIQARVWRHIRVYRRIIGADLSLVYRCLIQSINAGSESICVRSESISA